MLLHEVEKGAYVCRGQNAADKDWCPHSDAHWPGVVLGHKETSAGKWVVSFLLYHHDVGWKVHHWAPDNLEVVEWK